MTISEALHFLETAQYWRFGRRTLTIHLNPASPVHATVRRRQGESLEAMILRGVGLAQQRSLNGWKDPNLRVRECVGCGRLGNGYVGGVRIVRRQSLCAECRKGLARA